MCGIAAIVGPGWADQQLDVMRVVQRHRGPDAEAGGRIDAGVGLAHTRLSIIDLSPDARQPMSSPDGRLTIVFNGEVYNYIELRRELDDDYAFRTQTDTEVILAAYQRWGPGCLDRFIGMFALVIWDAVRQELFAARDRFGVKPLYYAVLPGGAVAVASEIKALHAAGVPAEPDTTAWATYLAHGLSDHASRTFWQHISSLPPGHTLIWRQGVLHLACWYDVARRTGHGLDERPLDAVREEYAALLRDSVRLRFRSDVPVGVALSGGLDSSLLLGLVHAVQGPESDVKVFTFVTGDPAYDELPWVERMLAATRHELVVCRLEAAEVPVLAARVQQIQDEPFGGVPTLAYARVFEQARAEGVAVLLDGQGMDEQWAGYDYFHAALAGHPAALVQGSQDSPLRPQCLTPEFRACAEAAAVPAPFPDALRNLQYRDLRVTKIPRALRYSDRVSMLSSRELREPFLDHRLVELALRQPPERKIADGISKWLPRQIARDLLPQSVADAPKRPVQTPQREWLRGPLREWANTHVEEAIDLVGGAWLDARSVRREWDRFCRGESDNSFYVWQWLSIGLLADRFSEAIGGGRAAALPEGRRL